MEEKIETITEEEIERRRKERDKKKIKDVSVKTKEMLTSPSEGKVDNKQILPFHRVLPTEPVMPLSAPPPVLSIGTQGRIQISLIRANENLYSEILLPPKFRSSTESRLVLQRPLIFQVADLGIVRPPALGLKASTQLLLPLLPESSIEVSLLIHPPLVGYSQSITQSSRTLPRRESINVTSTIQPLMSGFSLQSKPHTKDKEDILPTLETEKTSQKDKNLPVGAEISEEASGDDTEEEENFFEIMFRGEGLGKIEDGRPTVICIEDRQGESITGVVGTMCARLYREKKGGIPEPIIFTDIEEFKKDIRWIEAANKIFEIRLNDKDWESFISEGKDWKRFFDNRLDQLFSQDFGFIILNRQMKEIPFERHQRHHINIVNVVPKELTIEMKRRLAEIVWGFVEVDESLKSLDEIFEDGRVKFERALKKIQRQKNGIFVDATNPHEAEESNEHLWIKWFLVKCLVKHLIKKGELPTNPTLTHIKNKVETEVKDSTRFPNAVPDVAVGNKVYEVETLFSEDREGRIARNKITHTIDKYGSSVIINIVLDNITFLRHLEMLRQIIRNYEKDGKKNITFWTLDLKNEKLVSLEEVLKIMRELKAEISYN